MFFSEYLCMLIVILCMFRYLVVSGDLNCEDGGVGIYMDYGNIILLVIDGVVGLQVLDCDGWWIEVFYVVGVFVCNIGDCLM